MPTTADTAFGTALREWRARRRRSQLDLALDADVSARHVSFLETGRARPSRAMVLRLAGALDLPHDARDAWLHAAGFAPAFRRRAADDAEMRAARDAVAWMVDRHDPFPGFALDRHWRILRANRCAAALLGGFGVEEGDSLLDAFLGCAPLRAAIVNADEVAAHTRARLAAQARHYGDDPVLADALARLDALHGHAEPEPTAAFVPVRYRVGGTELSLLSAFAHFQTAQDIALSEWRVELMFPADEGTRTILTKTAASPP